MSDTAQAIEAVTGPLSPEIHQQIAAWERARQRTLGFVAQGIQALVRLYYDNYTDATELEGSYVDHLLAAARESTVDDALVFEAIRACEQELNQAGGVRSDTDGTTHLVRTASAWANGDE